MASNYIIASAEGEQAMHANSLSAVGNDGIRRGSVQIQLTPLIHTWGGVRDTWIHVRATEGTVFTSAFNNPDLILDFSIEDSDGNVMLAWKQESMASTFGYNPPFENLKYAETSGAALTTYPVRYRIYPDNTEFYNTDYHLEVTTVTNPDDTLLIEIYEREQIKFSKTLVDPSGWALPEKVTHTTRNDGSTGVYIQDVIVTDSIPTVGTNLIQVIPSSIGFYSAFNGDYTAINSAGYNPITSIQPTALGDAESWTHAATVLDLDTIAIDGMIVSVVGAVDAVSGIADIEPFTRSGGIDYAGTDFGLSVSIPSNGTTLFPINPATSTRWSSADIATLEVGVKAI